MNGIFQNPDDPLMFIAEEDLPRMKKGCLIIDVSCDQGMGFFFAVPTTFDEPMIKVGSLDYYAVDHTPQLSVGERVPVGLGRPGCPHPAPVVRAQGLARKRDDSARNSHRPRHHPAAEHPLVSGPRRGVSAPSRPVRKLDLTCAWRIPASSGSRSAEVQGAVLAEGRSSLVAGIFTAEVFPLAGAVPFSASQ